MELGTDVCPLDVSADGLIVLYTSDLKQIQGTSVPTWAAKCSLVFTLALGH